MEKETFYRRPPPRFPQVPDHSQVDRDNASMLGNTLPSLEHESIVSNLRINDIELLKKIEDAEDRIGFEARTGGDPYLNN